MRDEKKAKVMRGRKKKKKKVMMEMGLQARFTPCSLSSCLCFLWEWREHYRRDTHFSKAASLA